MVRKKEDIGRGRFAKVIRILRSNSVQNIRADNRILSEQPATFCPPLKVIDSRSPPQTPVTPRISAIGIDQEQTTQFASPEKLQLQLQESDSFVDRVRTEMRYKEAVQQLEAALKLCRPNWETFQILDLTDVTDNDPIPQLQEDLNKTFDVRRSSIKNQQAWSKCKNAMSRIFTAMSPFAKSLLRIARDGQQVFQLSGPTDHRYRY
jgi:hypothetical protein